ncbi:Uncharacterised protein [Mycobacteroides abscessus subsp. massiliense]|nr:Uncharacterised protein [Mycobacteroides abscessus subsp. massiliense]
MKFAALSATCSAWFSATSPGVGVAARAVSNAAAVASIWTAEVLTSAIAEPSHAMYGVCAATAVAPVAPIHDTPVCAATPPWAASKPLSAPATPVRTPAAAINDPAPGPPHMDTEFISGVRAP